MPAVLVTILKSFVLPMVLEFIRSLLFGPTGNRGWRDKFFAKMREIIADSDTPLDDATFLPILDQIELATVKLDDQKFVMTFFTEIMSEISTKENPLKWADTLFEFMEQAIRASETTWDDNLLLPMLDLARTQIKDKVGQ